MRRTDEGRGLGGSRGRALVRSGTVTVATVLVALWGCSNGGAGDDAGAVSTTSLAVEAESCGDGVLDLYRSPPPACPNPAVTTEVFDRAALDAWLGNPTTTLDLKALVLHEILHRVVHPTDEGIVSGAAACIQGAGFAPGCPVVLGGPYGGGGTPCL